MNEEIEKKIEYYLQQPYTTLLERGEQNGRSYYVLRSLELEGCMTTGDTIEEAVRDFDDAMREWLGSSIRLGHPIPKPLKSRRYNGKVVLRMPPSLHELLMMKATEQGVSLNHYLVTSLAHNLGYEQGIQAAENPARTFEYDRTEPSPTFVRDKKSES